MPVLYDAKKPGISLLRWKGTLWETVFFSFWFWCFLLLNLMFITLRMTEVITKDTAPEIPNSSLAIVGSLVSFATVFFLNHVFKRFHEQILMMIALGGNALNVTALSTSILQVHQNQIVEGEQSREELEHLLELMTLDIARFANALNHMCYYSIADVDNYDYLVESLILTDDEVELLKEYKGKKTNLIAYWITDIISHAHNEGFLSDNRSKLLYDSTLEMRAKASALQDYQRFPIPLGYYHFLTVALHSWLALLAFSTPYLSHERVGVWVSFLCYLLILVSFMGVMGVASAHSDPWGEDASDIDIVTELNGTLRQTKFLLNQRFRVGSARIKAARCVNFKDSDIHTVSRSKSYQIPAIVEFFKPDVEKNKYLTIKNTELADIFKAQHATAARRKEMEAQREASKQMRCGNRIPFLRKNNRHSSKQADNEQFSNRNSRSALSSAFSPATIRPTPVGAETSV